MPKRTSTTGSELFIVDNSDADWKVLRYLKDWCGLSKSIDIATGYFEIGSLLALQGEWQKVDHIRILMGDEVSRQTRDALVAAITARLDTSIEAEKQKNDFLDGVGAIVDAIRSRKIECRVYRKDKFHAKAYITHARLEVVGAAALVGSSNFTHPGLTVNIELNVQITGAPVAVLQEWYEEHWKEAEDITEDILRTVERHIREFSPFEVYAKSLYELFADATPGEQVWEETQSQVFHVLDGYQQDGYRNLMRIGREFGGAFLCDGVGLGKTYVGLMLIERLIVRDKLNVVLLAPKGAIDSVWRPAINRYLRRLAGGAFSNLYIAAHTDLGLPKNREVFEAATERAHAIIIDEAHHFRNLGMAGTGLKFAEALKKAKEPTLFHGRRSRYRELYDMVPSPQGGRKEIFMLTATPINNSFHDLRHMIELFTQGNQDHFGTRLGIHSLSAHFRQMESRLDRAAGAPDMTDNEEAKEIMAKDPLVSAIVVQRSRAFVKAKQEKAGAPVTAFPLRDPPQRAPYSLKKVYGRLLKSVETAFNKDAPLFTLSMYYPLAYYRGPRTDIDPGDENRQKAVVALIRTGFLKRFESSVTAFRMSCERLLIRSLKWATVHVNTDEEKSALSEWQQTHVKLIEEVRKNQPHLFGETDEGDDDLFEEELLESVEKVDRAEHNVPKMLKETMADLDQLVEFLTELDKFDHRNDDKLKKLLKMLADDPILSTGKVLIFTEFADTADYILERLEAAHIDGVERIDSRTAGRDRLSVIRRFSPYYNGSSAAGLADAREKEIRVLISTDVLSEGLNLQDAARLINYDLHWNPVRLMQRIGRVDRRRNPEAEAALAADRPECVEARRKIVFYNFLPPDELNELLTLYSKVTRKALRISKALGIEGKKLLTQDDDYQDLQHFNEIYEGQKSAMELLELGRDDLFRSDPALAEKLKNMPLRVFSGKAHPKPGTKAVFFCFALPQPRRHLTDFITGDPLLWTETNVDVRWYLYDLATENILEDAPKIVEFIRCLPDTPRRTELPPPTLSQVRDKVEKKIKEKYFFAIGVPADTKAILKAWMELN